MSLREALARPEFGDGARWALVVTAPVVVAALAATAVRRPPRGWPVAGLLIVAASATALAGSDRLPGTPLVLGVILLGLVGLLHLPWRIPALVPGAVLVASEIPETLPAWARYVVIVGCLATGASGPLVDTRHRPGVGPALFAGAALGAWACVPDVEQAGVVAGAATVTALVSLVVPLRLGASGVAAATGLLLWAAAWGAVGRPAALIGAAAGLGLLVVGVAGLPRNPSVGAAAALVAGEAALAVVTSRVAGLASSPPRAAVISSAVLLPATVAAALLARVPVVALEPPSPLPGDD